MRPNFENMTTAELRTYCAYLYKVGCRAHKLISNINSCIDSYALQIPRELSKSKKDAEAVIGQLEVLGLDSNK